MTEDLPDRSPLRVLDKIVLLGRMMLLGQIV
jgi:hypothetical protein